MAKANIAIERLKAIAQEAKSRAKEERHKQIEALEIQRQSHLFDAKYECLVEVTDAIVEGMAKIAEIDKGNMLRESLRDKIQKFIDSIVNNIEYIEATLMTHNDSNDEAEVGLSNAVSLQYWKRCLQSNIDKIIDIYARPGDPGKNTLIDENEYSSIQNKIGDEVVAKTNFFYSVKRAEDKEINQYFDKRTKEVEEKFIKTSRQINADLAEQIGELLLSSITTEVASVGLNTDHSISAENREDQTLPLSGDTNSDEACQAL